MDFMLASPDVSLPQVRAGKIKAYAVTAKNRLPAAPEIDLPRREPAQPAAVE